MMQLIGHFENSFSLVVVYVVTNCDKPESRAINAFVHFFFLSNEHSGTLSELYCISFVLLLFAVHIVL